MKIFSAITWVVIALLVWFGLSTVAKGNPWLLAIGLLAFTIAIARLGDRTQSGTVRFLCISAVWMGIGGVLGLGIFFALKGAPLLLIFAFAGFVVSVARIGCATH